MDKLIFLLLLLIINGLLFEFFFCYFYKFKFILHLFFMSELLIVLIFYLYTPSVYLNINYFNDTLVVLSQFSNINFFFFFIILGMLFLFLLNLFFTIKASDQEIILCTVLRFFLLFIVYIYHYLIYLETWPFVNILFLYVIGMLLLFFVFFYVKLLLKVLPLYFFIVFLGILQVVDLFSNVDIIIEIGNTSAFFQLLLIFIFVQTLLFILYTYMNKEKRFYYLLITNMLFILLIRVYYLYCVTTLQPYLFMYDDFYILIKYSLETRMHYLNTVVDVFNCIYDSSFVLNLDEISYILGNDYNLFILLDRLWSMLLGKLIIYEKYKFILYRISQLF